MNIEERVINCINQINDKGFYIIEEEPNVDTFEFIYKVQKSGEYFLDLTPAKDEKLKKWVLRDDPKHKVSKSVISVNKLFWVTIVISSFSLIASLAGVYVQIQSLQVQIKKELKDTMLPIHKKNQPVQVLNLPYNKDTTQKKTP